MTKDRAEDLRVGVCAKLAKLLPNLKPAEVFIFAGREYLGALPLGDLGFGGREVTIAGGGIGDKLGRLRRWLEGESAFSG